MRIGIAGIGHWGKKVMDAFARYSDVTMCCTTGNIENRAWLTACHPSVVWVDDFGTIAASPRVDAVVVASPAQEHAAQASLALRHGKHVFVEKPLATTAAEATQLARLADMLGLQLFVGHTFLFEPGIERILARAAIDPAVDAAFTWRKHGSFGRPLLWTMFPHDLALALRLFSRDPVFAAVDGSPWDSTCDSAVVDLKFDGGTRARLDIDRTALTAEKTMTVTTASGERLTWSSARRGAQGPDAPLCREVRAFLGSIGSGTASRSDGALGVGVARAAELIAQVAPRTGGTP